MTATTTAAADTEPLTPAALRAVYVPAQRSETPTLLVIVDTEEEFDWHAPFSRDNTDVRAMRHVERLQAILSPYRAKPTYVIDYPVATKPDGYLPLRDLYVSGAADIGAHLHPWVNPPLIEEVVPRNSFAFRLGALEADKLRVLRDAIAETFGRSPTVYKAGRYGFGETTAAVLEDLGFDVDISINPRMNFAGQGGPDFGDFDARPFVFGRTRRLLEIPCSTDYVGMAAGHGRALHTFADQHALRKLRLVGILARLGVVNRVMLTPEGHTIDEMKALTRALISRGVRTLSLTLHSPSLTAGCTPYVRTEQELRQFLDRIREYCDFFFSEVGGVAGTPAEFFTRLQAAHPQTGAN
jgi:hypothetical protein